MLQILVAICVLTGYSITTASFAIYEVSEHNSGAKRLQHIAGISEPFYWTVNFLYDMVASCNHLSLSLSLIKIYILLKLSLKMWTALIFSIHAFMLLHLFSTVHVSDSGTPDCRCDRSLSASSIHRSAEFGCSHSASGALWVSHLWCDVTTLVNIFEPYSVLRVQADWQCRFSELTAKVIWLLMLLCLSFNAQFMLSSELLDMGGGEELNKIRIWPTTFVSRYSFKMHSDNVTWKDNQLVIWLAHWDYSRSFSAAARAQSSLFPAVAVTELVLVS